MFHRRTMRLARLGVPKSCSPIAAGRGDQGFIATEVGERRRLMDNWPHDALARLRVPYHAHAALIRSDDLPAAPAIACAADPLAWLKRGKIFVAGRQVIDKRCITAIRR